MGAELTDPCAPGGGEHSPVPASVAALRTVSGHSRPGQLCWPPAQTACAPGPTGACPGAPYPAAVVTTVASPFSLDPWAHSPRLSLSLAEVKGSSFGAEDILLPPWTVPHLGSRSPCRPQLQA